MNAQLVRPAHQPLRRQATSRRSRRSRSPTASSAASSATRRAPFADFGLSEEFTAVYRLHSLLPDVVARRRRRRRAGGRRPAARAPATPASPDADRRARHRDASPARSASSSPARWSTTTTRPSLQDMSIPGEPRRRPRRASTSTATASAACRRTTSSARELGLKPHPQLRRPHRRRRVVAAAPRRSTASDVDGRDKVDDIDLLVGTLCEGAPADRASASARPCSRSSSSTPAGACSAIGSTPTTTARRSTPPRASTGSTRPT